MIGKLGTPFTLPLQGTEKCQGISDEMSRFPLWFNRDTCRAPVIPGALEPFADGRKYLSTKQIPSSLLLRVAGSSSIWRNRSELLRSGFTLTEGAMAEDGSYMHRTLSHRVTGEGRPQYTDSLSTLIREATEISDLQNQPAYEDQLSDADSGESEAESPEELLTEGPGNLVLMRKKLMKIKYDDPWKIHAAAVWNEAAGKEPADLVVWSGDGIRLQDPLPVRLLGKSWAGGAKNRIRFTALADPEIKLSVIYNHTHWGRSLKVMCNDPTHPERRVWARTLRYRINRFLKGLHDPCASRAQIEELFKDPSEQKSLKARSERLIEMLKTVDGIFLQRYLAYPEEVWTWDRFDVYTLGNISNLIGDEFLDGELRPAALSVVTAYAQLKATRKLFKDLSHRGQSFETPDGIPKIPRWCRQFANVYKRFELSRGYRRVMLAGILSQTRGAGTPPPLVLLQSKSKFISTISTAQPPLTPTQRGLMMAALEEVLNGLPSEAFTGLATKARVTVTTSSSWEKTRREGGTVEAVRELITNDDPCHQVPVLDLETGRVETWKSLSDFDSIGEFIFWSCLDHTLRTPPEDLKLAFLTMIKEPGKARTVTKARACLKVVLDLVNKICSEPLKKGVTSSSSGMGASNHGWNLFNRLHAADQEDTVFALLQREETAYEGYVERTDTFRDLYMVSTDYEEATDRMQHEVASLLGGAWMRKCGIPRLLRALVQKTCFSGRMVLFQATGALEDHGARTAYPGVNCVYLRQGVLMGDPLTKPILHLVNVVARQLGSRVHDPDFYNKFPNGRQAAEEFLKGMEGIPPSPATVILAE